MAVQLREVAVVVGVASLLASAAHAQQYNFVIDPDGSGVTGDIAAVVGASGTLIGDWDPLTNPNGTRTNPTNSFFDFPGATENEAVNTDISLSTNAQLASMTSGAFGLTVDGVAASVSGLSVDLLSGAPITAPISAGVSYQTFTTANPTSFYPSIPVNIPLGEATINSLTVTQADLPAAGTLTPTGAFSADVSVLIPVVLSGSATFQGQEVPIQDLPLSVLFVGELTSDFGAAVLTGSFDFDLDEEVMVDIPLPEFPIGLPSLGGSEAGVILSLNANTLGINADSAVSLLANGAVVPAPAASVMAFGALAIHRRRRSRS